MGQLCDCSNTHQKLKSFISSYSWWLLLWHTAESLTSSSRRSMTCWTCLEWITLCRQPLCCLAAWEVWQASSTSELWAVSDSTQADRVYNTDTAREVSTGVNNHWILTEALQLTSNILYLLVGYTMTLYYLCHYIYITIEVSFFRVLFCSESIPGYASNSNCGFASVSIGRHKDAYIKYFADWYIIVFYQSLVWTLFTHTHSIVNLHYLWFIFIISMITFLFLQFYTYNLLTKLVHINKDFLQKCLYLFNFLAKK